MSNWVVANGGSPRSFATVAGTSLGAVVSAGANFVKGSYVELVSSVPQKTSGALLTVTTSTVSVRFGLDIAIGPAGSEVLVAENVLFSSVSIAICRIYLPLSFEQGQRVSVRASTSSASAVNLEMSLALFPSTSLVPELPNALVTCNANAATLAATVEADAGASVHTKGSWVELVSATPRAIQGFLLTTATGTTNGNTNSWYLIDFATGASGSEQVVLANLASRSTTSGPLTPGVAPVYIPLAIPAGQRIAARVQSNATAAVTRTHGLILHLV